MYTITKFQSTIGEQQQINVEIDTGVYSCFPIDDTNPTYLAWLETEDGQKYLAEQEAK